MESAIAAVRANTISLKKSKVARSLFKPGSSHQDIILLQKVATTVQMKRARPQE